MKTAIDHSLSFKLLAAAIIAGVILALTTPGQASYASRNAALQEAAVARG